MNIKKFFYNWWYSRHEPEMVGYWKTKVAIKAKVTTADDGSYIMWMDGEKYPFPGFPRGTLLFNSMSKCKHEIKNFIFNDSWDLLEKGQTIEALDRIKNAGMEKIVELYERAKYDMLPVEKMCPAVREIHRGFTVVAGEIQDSKRKYQIECLRDIMCFIMQEDDGYRFRLSWTFKFFPIFKWMLRRKYVEKFIYSLEMLENAEIVDDMKGRIRLLRRIVKLILRDPTIWYLFNRLFSEIKWNKVKLTKADKYYFRAKWFKVDFPEYEY